MKPPLFPLIVVFGSAALHPLAAQGPNQPANGPEATIASGGEVAAATAADVWLAMVDDGRYAGTWDSAASIFKKAVAKERWVDLLKARRQPLGKLLMRKNTSRQFTKTIPNAPEGQYVVLQFDTSYENKKAAVETVTCVLDVDGGWRVTGYLVR